jgi:hypothetical protein
MSLFSTDYGFGNLNALIHEVLISFTFAQVSLSRIEGAFTAEYPSDGAGPPVASKCPAWWQPSLANDRIQSQLLNCITFSYSCDLQAREYRPTEGTQPSDEASEVEEWPSFPSLSQMGLHNNLRSAFRIPFGKLGIARAMK